MYARSFNETDPAWFRCTARPAEPVPAPAAAPAAPEVKPEVGQVQWPNFGFVTVARAENAVTLNPLPFTEQFRKVGEENWRPVASLLARDGKDWRIAEQQP